MSVSKVIIISLLFCFTINSLTAQLADNFEFLNHEVRGGRLGACKVFNDDLYYVNHNTFFINPYELHPDPYFTSVYKVKGDNEVEEILRTRFNSRSKIIENPDSSFDIILYDLIETDLSDSGFIAINVDSNTIRIDTFSAFNLDTYQATNLEPLTLTENIYKNENGDWISFDFQNYYSYSKTGIIATVDFYDITYHELLNNSDQHLFGLALDETMDNSIVYRLIDGAVDSVAVIEGASEIENLHNDSSGNYLQSSDRLIQYSKDFSEIINEWPLDIFGGEIITINSYNGKVEVLVEPDRLYELMTDGEISLVSDNLLHPQESNTFFQRLDEEQILFGGEHEFESITENVYFRNVNINDNSSANYPRVDVGLQDVELIYNNQENTLRIKLDIVNQGDESLEITDLFSRLYQPEAPITFRQFMELSYRDIDIGDAITLDTILNGYLEDLSFVIPGADYKFNASQDAYWVGEVISSLADIQNDSSVRISPNPCADYIHIDADNNISSLSIYNEVGQLVYLKKTNNKSIDNTIDVSHLESGLYYLMLSYDGMNGKTKANKFVKN